MKKGKKEKIENILSIMQTIIDKINAMNATKTLLLEIREIIQIIIKELNELTIADQSLFLIIDDNMWETYLGDIEKLKNELNSFVYKCKKKLDTLPSIKYQVVFMPYSAAMWDSFNSIFQEIQKEQHVEVIVMPIPYWGADTEKQFKVFYYEKDLFSKELPIVDYRETSLDELNPDVIFIHNPYDECNTLTRVFPEFYSSNLRKLTNHLVYIPYYLSDENTTNDQTLMPGVRNAWRVYVQSDKVRAQMISMGNLPDKIKSIGSPKIDDFVSNLSYENLPDDWKFKIAGKKVFALITTLVSVLNRPVIFLEKMKYIYQYFAGRDDVAVIWRPHPHTSKLLKGDFLHQYNELLNLFRGLENGIVDDGSNNHLVLKLCDAYIGERSSMLTLFKVTGKPVYIMNWKVNRLKEGERPVHINSIVCTGDMVVGIESNYKAFFELNIKTNQAKYCMGLQDNLVYESLAFRNGLTFKDMLFVAAANSSQNVLYNVKTGEMTLLDSHRNKSEYGAKNINIISESNMVYLFPFLAEPIIQFDILHKTYKMIPVDMSLMENLLNSKEVFTWNFGLKHCNEFWLGSKLLNAVVKVSMNGDTKVYPIKCIQKGIRDAVIVENKLVLLPDSGGDIIEFDMTDYSYNNVCFLEKYFGSNIPGFIRMVKFDSKWLLVKLGWVVLIDEEHQIKYEWEIANTLFLSLHRVGEEVFLFAVDSELYGKCDLNTNNFEVGSFILDEKEQIRMREDFYKQKRVIGSENYFYSEDISSMNSFVYMVLSEQNVNTDRTSKEDENLGWIDGSCGTRIWEDIRKNL